eukprot:10854896-Lingulodinium_polyedra.AAC.1
MSRRLPRLRASVMPPKLQPGSPRWSCGSESCWLPNPGQMRIALPGSMCRCTGAKLPHGKFVFAEARVEQIAAA